jgi:energy-coupling factor transporter ATP-binding protein EcfA2
MLTSAAPTTSSVAGSRRTGGAAVEVVEVTQERPTLHDVSFSVAPGEVVAIVWGSGTGETTLLETLVGIRPPATGAVRISGSKSGSEVGYVPRTTSSTGTCRWLGRSGTPRSSGSRQARQRTPWTGSSTRRSPRSASPSGGTSGLDRCRGGRSPSAPRLRYP